MNKKMSIMAIALFFSAVMNGMERLDLGNNIERAKKTATSIESCLYKKTLKKVEHPSVSSYRNFLQEAMKSEDSQASAAVSTGLTSTQKLKKFNKAYNKKNFDRSIYSGLLTVVSGLGFGASLKYSDNSVVKATTGTSFVASLLSFFNFSYLANTDVRNAILSSNNETNRLLQDEKIGATEASQVATALKLSLESEENRTKAQDPSAV